MEPDVAAASHTERSRRRWSFSAAGVAGRAVRERERELLRHGRGTSPGRRNRALHRRQGASRVGKHSPKHQQPHAELCAVVWATAGRSRPGSGRAWRLRRSPYRRRPLRHQVRAPGLASKELRRAVIHWELPPIAAELSPPLEPFDPLADPEMKEALDIINMDESIVDEVVNKLLHEVAEKVLKEE